MNVSNLISDFVRDWKHSIRAMRKAPVFAFFAVLTLGLGIGASTTVFTVVNTLLINPLPARDPSGLVALYTTQSNAGRQARALLPSSYLNLQDIASRNAAFSALGGYTPPLVMTLNGDTGPQRIFGELVTARYFEALGIRPGKGRFFLQSEDTTPGSASVAVLSYGAWQRKFGGAANIISRSLDINGTPFTVIGVAPAGFIGVSAVFGPDVWLPATMAQQVLPAQSKDALTERGKSLFHAIARLKPGISREQAQADMQTVAAALQREYPQVNETRSVSVQPVTNELFSSAGGEGGLKFASTGLLVLVGVVLLIWSDLSMGHVNPKLTRSGNARKRISGSVNTRSSTGGSEERVRRLITLISAGRNRIIVIRRELPRTEDASWAGPYRTKDRRILLAVSSSTATGAASKTCKTSSFSGSFPLRLRFGFDGDGPGEAQQFASDRSDNLGFIFAARREFLITGTQTPLRFPGNVFGFLVKAFLALEQKSAHPWFVLIGPSRFHHHSSQMRIAGFGNTASLDAIAAGIFTRHQSAVTHQLAGTLEPAQRARFGHDGQRRHLRDAAQRLECGNHGTNLFWSCLDGFIDGLLQPGDSFTGMMHFMHIVRQRRFECRLLKVHMVVQPSHVLCRPLLLDIGRRLRSVPQQKFSQPLTSPVLILPGIFARPHQIAQRFVGRIGHPDRRQVAAAITARQLLGVAPIRFHAIASFGRYQRRRNHFARNAQLCQLPVQNVPRRTRLIAGFQLLHRTELRHQFPDRLQVIRYNTQTTDFAARLRHRYRDRAGVDIQTNKTYLRHATNSFRMRLCAAGFNSSQRNPRYCEGLVAPF